MRGTHGASAVRSAPNFWQGNVQYLTTSNAAHTMTCKTCAHTALDLTTRERGWCGIQCTNPESLYHRSLLNVTEKGDRITGVTWGGCDKYEKTTKVPDSLPNGKKIANADRIIPDHHNPHLGNFSSSKRKPQAMGRSLGRTTKSNGT